MVATICGAQATSSSQSRSTAGLAESASRVPVVFVVAARAAFAVAALIGASPPTPVLR
jgi:hypothetical protein